jgi:hypothetical protein
MDNTYQEIQQRKNYFDMDSEDVLETLSSMGGFQSTTPKEDLAGNGNAELSLVDAVDAETVRKSQTWTIAEAAMQAAIKEHEKKAAAIETANPTRHLDRAEGIREALTIIGTVFAEAEERLKGATSEEKLLLPAKTASSTLPDTLFSNVEPELPKLSERDENTKKVSAALRQQEKIGN